MQTLSFVPINGHVSENSIHNILVTRTTRLYLISSKRSEGLSKRELKYYEMIPALIKVNIDSGLQKKTLGKSNKVKHSECVFLELHGQVRITKIMFGTGSNIHLYLP